MPPIAWLLVALLAGVGAYLVARPAWQSSRARQTRDTNTERYLAWRGRAVRPGGSASREMSADERRRLYLSAALGALAVTALAAFFVTS